MKTGRSNYSVQFNTDAGTINNLVQSYLNAENFVIHEKKGEQYFRSGDQLAGYKGLKYSIDGQSLNIEAWLDGALGNFPLEQNSMNIMAMNYRNSINKLFQEISKLNSVNMNSQQNNNSQVGQTVQINSQQSNQDANINQFAQTFQNENIKKQEKLCEIGFWLSVFGLVASFFGVLMGLIVYILDFYFASQGLKTKKRGKAIATIVLSIISILVIIFQFILV